VQNRRIARKGALDNDIEVQGGTCADIRGRHVQPSFLNLPVRVDYVPLRNMLLAARGEASTLTVRGAAPIPDTIVPRQHTPTNLARTRVLATPVQRSVAETAIRPPVFAASALGADRHKQAITQQKLEVVLRNGHDPVSRREEVGPSASAAVTANIRGVLVIASV